MAISLLHSLGEGDMAHITQQLSRKQGLVGYITVLMPVADILRKKYQNYHKEESVPMR